MKFKTEILDEVGLNRAIKRLSHEIIEHNNGVENIVLVGIKTRGVPFAKQIQANLLALENILVPLEELDITLYRDDLSELDEEPLLNKDSILSNTTGKIIILCDDVVYTGRTCRAAIDAVMKHGRPKNIQFAVIVDRGHRELPIRADFIGKNIPTSKQEVVAVKFKEVTIYPKTITITNTIETKKPTHWGLGIHAGYGATLNNNTVQLSPYVGVGISYNILTW